MADDNTDNVSQSKLVTVVEAAEILKKSERTIRRMMSAGKLPVVKTKDRTFIQMAGIDNMAEIGNMPVKTDDKADDMTDIVKKSEELRDRIESQYRDTIRRLEEENSRLWSMVQSMLPPPASPPVDRPGALPLWILAAIVTAVLIIGGLLIYLLDT